MAKETKNKKEKKHFFRDFKAELKKVIWPTPKQLFNNTVAVITIVLITAVIVFVLDVVFEKMNTLGINKIKEAVNPTNEISETTNVDTNSQVLQNIETTEESNAETTPVEEPATEINQTEENVNE